MQSTPAKTTDEIHAAKLWDALLSWEQLYPDQLALVHLADGENVGMQLSYAQLVPHVKTLARHLLDHVKPGECVVVCIDSEAEFLLAVLACFIAKIIAIPSLTPNNDRTIKRIEAHWSDSGAGLVLFDNQALRQLKMRRYEGVLAMAPSLNISELGQSAGAIEGAAQFSGDDIAYLQYTSGSTREPRGVMITQANLAEQLAMLQQALKLTAQETIVNWMPLHHDFGLVTSLLAFYTGGCCVLLPPVRVVQQPIRWLRAISHFRAGMSAGAVFMFDLCTRKIQPEQCVGLDLSSLQRLLIGAEPIHASIVRNFFAAFNGYGFKSSALWPAYGMAEATLVITLKQDEKPIIRSFDAGALQQRRVSAAADGPTLVGSGQPVFADSVRIVDPETGGECSVNSIGELWVKNPCIGKGYWRHSEVSQASFDAWLSETGEGPFLRTGDLAFIHEREVFIAGRIKDTIIINGENRYPQDIEWAIQQCHPALEPGACAAIGIAVDESERLAVICEVKRTARGALNVEEVVSAIRAAAVKQQEVDVHTVVLLQTAGLPKTSSGKVQRQTCKKRFLADDLPTIAVWRQPQPKPAAPALLGGDALLNLCRNILGDTSIGPDHNLFAHGADSIKATELIAAIESRWQCTVDLLRFNQLPTVNGLLALLPDSHGEQSAWPETEPKLEYNRSFQALDYFPALAEQHLHQLLAYTSAWQADWVSPNRLIFGLNRHGSKPPLFWCFQGMHEFSQLARYLGPEQPLYGLRSGHLIFDYTDKSAMTALAGHYLAEILQCLPQSVYWLGGNCQAGVLATRMAQLLYGLGGDVRQLFVLENIAPRVNAYPLPFKVALFFGRGSTSINPYHQFPAPDSAWKKLYPLGYSLDIIKGDHGQFFDEPAIGDFAGKLALRLRESQQPAELSTLPQEAFAAELMVYPVVEWSVGETVEIAVNVKNASPLPWPGQSGLIVANHWLDNGEQPLQWLDAYLPITEPVLPGQTMTIKLAVAVPQNPGSYILELDLAEQGIVWFKDKGNPSYRMKVEIK